MLFNSIEFAIFLPIVFLLYWFVINKSIKTQNILLLAASYFFYGWWDWKALSLIVFSSIVDYYVGVRLATEERQSKRKFLLSVSLFVNIGFLAFFKYFNFFAESFADAFTLFAGHIEPTRLNIILPVGISFYTFQTLSYSIDVYRRKLEPTKDVVAFFTFVSFFPQLVAGPIERATNLLPQFYKSRQFDYAKAVDGLRQITWGLFKKIVIADSCAVYVNDIFANHSSYSGSTLFIGGVFFAFQIYGDFSGYSDIAIGTSRLFGFDLMKNFAFPYFSRDIAEFWRRWHISLSTWFKDYVYIPLGGSKGNKWMKIRNTFVIFLVSGFWHGANWTFIVWGFINALYFLPLMLRDKNRKNTNVVAEGKQWPSVLEIAQMGLTFFLTIIAWIFFRADNLTHAFAILKRIFSPSFIDISSNWTDGYVTILHLSLIVVLVLFDWKNRSMPHGLSIVPKNAFVRKSLYVTLVFFILFLGNYHTKTDFIYFQF